MPKPTVSIIMPAFNAERTIETSIRSVLDGAFGDFELIICDDASTDSTVDVIERVGDPRVRLQRNATNQGAGASRNRCLDIASGRWIAELDADDAYDGERLATLVPIARANPGALVFDDVMRCHDAPAGLIPYRAMRRSLPRSRNGVARCITIEDWLTRGRKFMFPLMPAETIARAGAKWIPRLPAHDLHFYLQILAATRAPLLYVAKPMYRYRLRPGSISAGTQQTVAAISHLEQACGWFADDPSIVSALHACVRADRTEIQLRELLDILRARAWISALRHSASNPRLAATFTWRALRALPYHCARIAHRGSPR